MAMIPNIKLSITWYLLQKKGDKSPLHNEKALSSP